MASFNTLVGQMTEMLQ